MSLGVLAAGLCLAPAAVSAPGDGQQRAAVAHREAAAMIRPVGPGTLPALVPGSGAGVAAATGASVQAAFHGDGGPRGGDSGQGQGGWGGSHGDPGQGGQGQGGWGGSGQGGSGQGGSGSTGGEGGSASPQAVPSTSSTSAGGSQQGGPGGNPWGGSGGSHGDGQGSGSSSDGNGRHNGSGSGHGSGNGNGNGNGNSNGNGSGASATPSTAHPGSSSSSSSSSSSTTTTTATPAVSTAAAGSGSSTPSAPATPAAGTPATTSPVAVSVNPAQPAPTTAKSSPATTGTGTGTPTGRRTQRASSRSAKSSSAGAVAARTGAGAGAAATTFRRIATAGAGVARGLTAAATSPVSTAAPLGASRRRSTSAGALPQPLDTLGHELSTVPSLVGRLVPLPVPDWSKPVIFALLLVCALLGLRAWLTGHRARRLETQRQQLAADLDSIQAALIPEIPPRLGGLDISAAYRPADGPGAGGDFYDAFALDADRVAIIVGDVSGHGRVALGRAAHMHYTLRAYVEMGLEPRAALKLAGRVLGADKDDLFTTVAVAVHDAGASTLTYATAGHPAPVLLGSGAHEPLTRCASPALGWGVATGRRQTTVPFPDGARACFFTDGVTEARVEGELLGRDRLGRILSDLGSGFGARALLETVQQQTEAIHDDMAACIITATAGAAVSEQRLEELEIDLRQIGSGQAERFLEACGVPAREIEMVLADARVLAADGGVSLLRVELEGGEATATVTGPAQGRWELQQA
ncbi:MAG TPA: SpoIIE family protein phosphatase [Solirubrobacteraceae bacterium]|nr:SpoIIE family protein phosphatase [Solirubrobacteraceae bacterium]